ncbi:AAA family ATPase [Mycolicibacterium helvum]|uniref:Helix-turn-helix transcriptional regulator n=1 Tax=Mycolicibacterium helvum TaxID=1534349 RepID=A0A7I7SZN7_9MYCO|nr:LuxR family transcriptional regulator [Mycolicibacterium helvum]BBY62120.1 helix-turn-helix transcriptional regulator [Mycolicibacterium helvum]
MNPSRALLGRTVECRALDDLVETTRAGRSAVLVLRGDAGIGKTALLRYLTDSARGVLVTRCTGVESEMELPFAALYDLCAPMLDGLQKLPHPQRRALNVALGQEAGDNPDRLLVALGALGLLAATSAETPLLCVVEDAHWLDHASAQVVGFIGRRLLAEPIGLVLASRAPVFQPDPFVGLPELAVSGLDTQAARHLLASLHSVPIDEQVRDRIIDEAQGNPLGLHEFGTRVRTAGFGGGFVSADAVTLSRRIEDEYLAQLSAMPRDTRQLLILAAADPVGDTALIARASRQLGLSMDAATAAVHTSLLTIGASVRFRHPVLRSVVYRMASADERRASHAALAAASDPQTDPDRAAWHRAHATSGPDEAVAVELIASAGRAQARGGAAAAAAFWDRAVVLSPDPADRISRALIAAQAKLLAGDLDAAQRLLAELRTGIELSDMERVTVDLLQAQVAFLRRDRDAPELLFRAAQLLQALDPASAWPTYLQALIATSYAGRLGSTQVRLEIANAALALPMAPAPTPTVQLLVHGVATWMARGYVAAAPTLKEAVHRYRSEAADPGFLGFGFNVMAMHLCDDEAWYALVAKQVAAARTSGMLSWLPFMLDGLAEIHVHAGELNEAETILTEAERIDPLVTASTPPRIALLLAAWRGDAPGVRTWTEPLSEAAHHQGQGWLLEYSSYAQAVLHNGLADYATAANMAESACTSVNVVPAVAIRALYELAEAAARATEVERAGEAARQLTELAAASGTDWAHGMAARSIALVTAGPAAEDRFTESIERLERTRMAIDLARARLSYGEWLRRQNRRTDARVQLAAAHDALSAMGVRGFADRARRELQATGEKVRARAATTDAELTAQEEQIAQRARLRRTNAEIGAELFLSARTVEWHLGKIYTKMQITSRRQLDDALRRRDQL